MFLKKPLQWLKKGVEPTENMKQNGFKMGDKLPAEYVNEFLNRTYEAIEELQEKSAEKTDLDVVSSDVQIVNNELLRKVDRTYFDMIIASLVDGGPRELFYSVATLQSTYPTGEIGTYLVFDSSFTDGAHTFMWNGTAWEDLGVYQAYKISDDAVSKNNIKTGNVTLHHLDFVKQSTKNLFDGKYHNGVLWHNNDPDRLYARKNFNGSLGKVAIVPVEEGIYTISFPGLDNDRFRLGASNTIPEFTYNTTLIAPETELPLDVFLVRNDNLKKYTVTVPSGAQYLLVFASNIGHEPRLQVERGSVATSYTHPKQLPIGIMEHYHTDNVNENGFIPNRGLNVNGLIINDTTTEGVAVFMEVDPNTEYHVRKIDKSNRFRIALSETVSSPTVGQTMRIVSSDDTLNYTKITTGETDRFMMIYLSNAGERPLVNVTKNKDYLYYKTPKIIDKNLEQTVERLSSESYTLATEVEVLQSDVDKIKPRRDFFVVGNPALYTSTNYANPTGKQTVDVLAIYDTIENSPLVSKQILGYDGLNNPIYEYVIDKPLPHITNNVDYQPTDWTYERREKIKILINSGTHGDEKGAAYGLALFIKDLVERTNDPALKFIRDNVTFKIIPVLNPSGYDAHSRYNHNNVDINRDYVAKTQLETQIVTSWVDDNLDAVACLDYHNSSRTVSFWPARSQQIYHELFYAVINWVNDSWQEFDPTIKNPVGELVLTEQTVNLNTYSHNRGMFGITVEGGRHSSAINDGIISSHDALGVKYGNELLAATIMTLIRYFS